MRRSRRLLLVGCVGTLLPSSAQAAPTVELVSTEAHTQDWHHAQVSSDGTRVLYGQYNGGQIYLKNLRTGRVDVVSAGSSGPGNGDSMPQYARMSDDGRYVVFTSSSTNLVPNDTNAQADVFLRDTVRRVTRRLNVDRAGRVHTAQYGDGCGLEMSGDGVFAYFCASGSLGGGGITFAPDFMDSEPVLWSFSTRTGKVVPVSVDDAGRVGHVQVSPVALASRTGRYVVFKSQAKLVTADNDQGSYDVYLRDTVTKRTVLVPAVANPQGFAPDLLDLDDGGGVLLYSVGEYTGRQTYVHNLRTGAIETAEGLKGQNPPVNVMETYAVTISADGRYVFYAGGMSSRELAKADFVVQRATLQRRDLRTGKTDVIDIGFDTAKCPGWPSSALAATSAARDGRTLVITTWRPLSAKDGNCVHDVYRIRL